MNIVIDGLWHLGLVTTAGMLTLNNEVCCYSNDCHLIEDLSQLKLPLYEKNLNEILKINLNKKKLTFTCDKKILEKAKIYWYCLDTPIDDSDEGNVTLILKNIFKNLDKLKYCQELIISSQISVGSIKKIENKIQKLNLKIRVTYIPENLRLGKSIERFLNPDRIIVGCRHKESKKNIIKIFGRLSNKIIFVRPESAELIKHSINGFLANSICFINEITRISKLTLADPKEVSLGLKTDERIGLKSYLSPGSPYGGGTLGRDVMFFNKFSKDNMIKLPLLNSISLSNQTNKNLLVNYLRKNFKKHKNILFLGLTYTEGTSTLRRSEVIKLVNWMIKKSIQFSLHDPILKTIPTIDKKYLIKNLNKTIKHFDTIIIMYNHTFYAKYQNKIKNLSNIKKIFIHDPFMILNFMKNARYI